MAVSCCNIRIILYFQRLAIAICKTQPTVVDVSFYSVAHQPAHTHTHTIRELRLLVLSIRPDTHSIWNGPTHAHSTYDEAHTMCVRLVALGIATMKLPLCFACFVCKSMMKILLYVCTFVLRFYHNLCCVFVIFVFSSYFIFRPELSLSPCMFFTSHHADLAAKNHNIRKLCQNHRYQTTDNEEKGTNINSPLINTHSFIHNGILKDENRKKTTQNYKCVSSNRERNVTVQKYNYDDKLL